MKATAADIWQPIALSESIGTDVPIRVCFGEDELALFRDNDCKVHALEDRCPHRRVPLSLGKVIDGDLRCAYHGWTFDGASGACTQIPNLSDEEKVPSRYKVAAYRVQEANGFIFLWRGEKSPSKTDPRPTFAANEKLPLHGSLTVPLETGAYGLAMLDGPETLLGFHGVGITDFFLGDPFERDGAVIIDRAAGWLHKGKQPSKWASDYPFILRTTASLREGTFTNELIDERDVTVAQVYMGAIPGLRGTTNIVWRGQMNSNHPSAAKINRNKNPIEVFSTLDGMAIAGLLIGPSKFYQEAI